MGGERKRELDHGTVEAHKFRSVGLAVMLKTQKSYSSSHKAVCWENSFFLWRVVFFFSPKKALK